MYKQSEISEVFEAMTAGTSRRSGWEIISIEDREDELLADHILIKVGGQTFAQAARA